jgi:hypothetical protein
MSAHVTLPPIPVPPGCGCCLPAGTVDLTACNGCTELWPARLYATFTANADGSPQGYQLGVPYTLDWDAAGGQYKWNGEGRTPCVHSGSGCIASGTQTQFAPIDASTCAAATVIGGGLNLGCASGLLIGTAGYTRCSDGTGFQALRATAATPRFTVLSCRPVHLRYENKVINGIGAPYGVLDITE